MGIETSGDGATTDPSGREVEDEGGYEDESVVHNAASIGDAEVNFLSF